MLSRTAAAALGHILASAPWARDILAPFVGRRARLVCGPLVATFLVTAHGGVAGSDATAPPDVTVSIPPGAALRLAAGDETAYAEARVDGDAEFAVVVRSLATGLVWDFEEDLSRVLGDIAAHRAAGAIRSVAATGRDSVDRVGRALGEYATEEGRLTPPRAELEAWMADVDLLRDDVERLAQRVARLERGSD